MILQIIASVLLVIAIAAFFGLSPEQITNDLMRLITPNDTIRDKSRNMRYRKKRHGVYRMLVGIKSALSFAGKSKQFTAAICASVVLFGVGIIISILLKNLFLMPVIALAFALIPFMYITNTISVYETHMKEELETALSIITTSYERCDDIVQAVRENMQYIKPPLCQTFMEFDGEATAISSNIKHALFVLREKVDNEVFREWVDTLILCQDDRTLKDTLQPVVQKLADVRLVNSELKTMLISARNEYLMMVALVVANIPILFLLNKDWFHTLIYTIPGKVVCGLCGTVILVTAFLMKKFTRPIEYKR